MENKSLQPVSAARLLAGVPMPPMLIEGLVPRRGLVMFSADPYVGKTFLALEAARAVASHTPFLGRFQAWGGKVLFVEEDSPAWDLGKQFIKLAGAQNREARARLLEQTTPGCPMPTALEDNLYFLINQRVSLDTVEDTMRLARAARELGVDPEGDMEPTDLIVLDTLRSLHSGDENDSTWMSFVLGNLRLLQEQTGAAILILHHHNKPAQGGQQNYSLTHRIRGSSVILGALDGVVALSKVNSDGLVRAQMLKSRAIQTSGFHYWILPTEDGGIELRYHEGKTDLVTKVRELFASKSEVTWEDLLAVAKAVHPFKQEPALRTSVSRVLSMLEGQNFIQKKGRGTWIRHPQWKPMPWKGSTTGL